MPVMLDEIHEQPRIVQAVLTQEQRNIERLCKAIRSKDIDCVVIAGRGTSDHAATVAKYLIEITNGLPVALAAPSVVTLYRSRLSLSRCLVMGVSQTDSSEEVVEYVAEARRAGALTVGITSDPDSELSRNTDYNIFCHVGEERGVATTKSYTAALAACYLFALTLAENREMLDNLMRVPEMMQKTFETEQLIHDIAPRYRYMEECFVMARGINHATAYEAALKIAETSYVGARAYSVADFAHGPIAVVHEGFSCFMFAPAGKAFSSVVNMIGTLSQKRAETIVYSNSEEALRRATIAVRMPVDMDEILTPLVYILPAQLFAYYLALTKGYNPDRPRGAHRPTLSR